MGRSFDVQAVLEGITGAVKHLHSLGWVSGPINPDHVMLASDGAPVIINLGMCLKEGAVSGSCQEMDGVYVAERRVVSKDNDIEALKYLKEWLKDPKVSFILITPPSSMTYRIQQAPEPFAYPPVIILFVSVLFASIDTKLTLLVSNRIRENGRA